MAENETNQAKSGSLQSAGSAYASEPVKSLAGGRGMCDQRDSHTYQQSLRVQRMVSRRSLKPDDNKFHKGNGEDGKHYWLTPPNLYAELDAQYTSNHKV